MYAEMPEIWRIIQVTLFSVSGLMFVGAFIAFMIQREENVQDKANSQVCCR